MQASAGGALFCDVPESKSTCSGHGCSSGKTYLAGLVSWSNSRCGKKGLAVITEMSPYVAWIDDLLKSAGGIDHFNPEYYGYYEANFNNYGERGIESIYSRHGDFYRDPYQRGYGGGYGNSYQNKYYGGYGGYNTRAY